MILHCKGDPAAAVGGLVPRAAAVLLALVACLNNFSRRTRRGNKF